MPGPGTPQVSATALNNAAFAGVHTTNTTTHHFLGGPQKSWMTNTQDVNISKGMPARNVQSPKTTVRHRPRASLGTSKTGPPTAPAAGGNESSAVQSPQQPLLSQSPQNITPTITPISATANANQREATDWDQTSANAHATRNTPQSQSAQLPSPSDFPRNAQSPTIVPTPTSGIQQAQQDALNLSESGLVVERWNATMSNFAFGKDLVQDSPAQSSTGVQITFVAPQTIPGGIRGTKRTSDAELIEGESGDGSRRRKSSSGIIIPAQLPTPHDSPTTSTTDLLSQQLETALDALTGRARTVDMTPVVDDYRMSLLRDACRKNDMFFLATHWVLCVWFRQQNTPLLHLKLSPKHVEGLRILERILGSNRQLTREVLDICVSFPSSTSAFLATVSPQDPRGLIESAKTFLNCLATNFPEITNIFSARGWPPCPVELRYALQLPSVVLQKVLYVSLLRGRYADQSGWVEQATRLFDAALEDPAQNAHSASELMATNGQAVAPLAHMFGSQYSRLQSQYTLELHHQSRRQSARLHAAQSQGPPQIFHAPTQQPLVQEHIYHRGLISQPYSSNPNTLTLPGNPTVGHYNGSDRGLSVVSQGPLHHRPPISGNHHVPLGFGVLHNNQIAPQGFPINNHTQRLSSTSFRHVEARSSTTQAISPAPQSIPLPITHQRGQPSPVQPLIPRDPNFALPLLAIPDPDRRALHQAHLRSPFYEKVGEDATKPSPGKWFQFVEDLIMLPQLLDAKSGMVRWKVEIPHRLWTRKAKNLEPAGEFLTARRRISDKSIQFRLKCIGAHQDTPLLKMTLSEFCAQSGKWPQCLSVSINNDAWVEFQRKAHHGSDLPADVTEHLQETNEVLVCADFTPREAGIVYSMAIEVICIANRNTVLSMMKYMTAEESLASITAALKNTNNGKDDDELVISQPVLSIDIVDPFMSTMWVTPVRGQNCHHRDCFDLDAFLDSRRDTDGVTSPDHWKCPICKKDARPQMLVMDKFLFGVRQELARTNRLDAKAILVKEDGTWTAKLDHSVSKAHVREKEETETPEPRAGGVLIRDHQPTTSVHQSSTSTPQPDEIIILDDE
ncbi:hypothetical protein PV11_04100 [Exophiala sideris]|uniref:SP-RING-type domain-containing protein n=1 Tax=Exophiala sideris TaxID=1016849 RepID=A0A0D1YLL8_9EURO|nr:hypothetical protein PV11_04100 [Exophiala sideris]